MSTSEQKTTKGKGEAKASPAPSLENATKPSAPAKSKPVTPAPATPAETEKEIEERLRAKIEAEYAEKAKETVVKDTPGSQEEIAKAVAKTSEELGAKPINRIVIIRANNVATNGEVQLGQLLPGNKKGYHVYKNDFDVYVTGLTDEELMEINKRLPVWDVERKIPNPEFWKKYSLVLGTSEKRLHIDKNDRQFIDWKVALSHPDIANSESKLNSRTPFFIVDEEAEAEQSNRELNALTKSYNYITNMTATEKKAFLSLLGIPSKDSTESVATLHLRQQAEEFPEKFVSYYEDTSKKEKLIISEMVEYNVLRKSNGAYYYNEVLLAVDMLATVQWMSDPKNQEVKLKLMQQLELAKKQG